MEKTIWIIDNNKKDLLDIQRKINAFGGLRAMCIFSSVALQKIIEERVNQNDSLSNPSLILINYHMLSNDFSILELLKIHPLLAGTPFFFIIENGEDIYNETYYMQGAMVVLEKPIHQNGLLRIRQAAEQYEITKSYERIFQKQISELAAAKEIGFPVLVRPSFVLGGRMMHIVYDQEVLIEKVTEEGLKKRFGESVPKIYIERLKYELSVIEKMGFCNYFLVVQDYVKFAKENGSTYIVVGRSITGADDPVAAYKKCVKEFC